ncbi:hypothetical protein LSAT2_032509 [Lamellibrachia satsuma]|nr:hypothetical protein LSAT2_032509 [Lamellibrachia satsuma]
MMSTAQKCSDLLSSVTTRPVILIVDGIDQFEEELAVQIMSWVPCKLAPHVRCIFSVVSAESSQHEVFVERESKPQMLNVPPLDWACRQMIVEELLHDGNRLSQRQMNNLLCKQWSENPLWLSLACDELECAWDNREGLSQRIDTLPDDLLDLLDEVLERLAQGVDYHLFVAVLCLLVVSDKGLTPLVLLNILSHGEISPPSPYDEKDETESSEKEHRSRGRGAVLGDQWRRVYSTLERFLRPHSRQSR